jgi:hypothetical protein
VTAEKPAETLPAETPGEISKAAAIKPPSNRIVEDAAE